MDYLESDARFSLALQVTAINLAIAGIKVIGQIASSEQADPELESQTTAKTGNKISDPTAEQIFEDNVDNFIKNNVNSNFYDNVKNAFRSDIKVTTLTQDTLVYRYHGGDSSGLSYWYTPKLTSNPAADLALPPGNTYQYINTYIIPKGTTILEGTVAPNFGQPGGGYQYYVPDPSIVIQK